ncbi:MAG: S49 family peptidase [Planctomycetota bacterium]
MKLLTPPELLCMPLMMQQTVIASLMDETLRFLGGSGPTPESLSARMGQHPAVGVSYVDETGTVLQGETYTDADGEQRHREVETEGREPQSLIAIVQLSGVMTRHGYVGWWSSSPGTNRIGRMCNKLNADPAVHTIILLVNSPGGSVTGTPELSDIIFSIREDERTTILTCVDDLMASAATYVATAAEQVYSIPSAYSGSIGTIISYTSYHKYLEEAGIDVTYLRTPELKNRFTGVEPLTDAMKQTLEDRITESQRKFDEAMARNRKVSVASVAKKFGGGEVMRADEAVDTGLIDGIASIDQIVMQQAEKIRSSQAKRRRSRQEQRLQSLVDSQSEIESECGNEQRSSDVA